MVHSPKKSARPWRWKSALLHSVHLHLILAQPLRSVRNGQGRASVRTRLHLKVKTCCFARPGHMFAAGVFPPLLQDVVCPITRLRILSGILSSTFSKTGLRENLFAHVNTNRFNMLRTREIPAGVRPMRKARGSPKLQQFSLGWLCRITQQSHWALLKSAI